MDSVASRDRQRKRTGHRRPHLLREPGLELVEVGVEHRGHVERDDLREREAADDDDAEARRDAPVAPRPMAIGRLPMIAATVVIMIGPEPDARRLDDRLGRRLVSVLRSVAIAKSIIMIAFFFTIPISMIMPTKP